MKFSFMSFSCPGLGLMGLLDVVRRLGYDGLEPRLAAQHAHGIETALTARERAAARELVKQADVSLSCLATSCRFADPEQVATHVADAHRCIDLAADVGAPAIRVFGGGLPAGMDRAEAVERVTGALGELAPHARERGVTVCMETHDDWCDPVDVAAVVQRVDSPAIRVNWDIMHPVRRGFATIEESFEILGDWVAHVHFHDGCVKDGKLQTVPIGTGDIDHRAAVALLTKAGYTGYLSGEWINWEPWNQHLPRELATMKQYEQDL